MPVERTEIKDFRFHPSIRPKGGYTEIIDACDVVIYSNIGIDNYKVVILIDTDTGMSITNAAEWIVHQLIEQGHANHSDVFVEHYPEISMH